MKEEKKEIEEKEKRCPFDRTLKCENCRLHSGFLHGGKEKICVFLRMNV